jgi:hypothetical protein
MGIQLLCQIMSSVRRDVSVYIYFIENCGTILNCTSEEPKFSLLGQKRQGMYMELHIKVEATSDVYLEG